MRYTARKMGQHAVPIPDAVFETWDGKVIRTSPEFCWAIGLDIGDIVMWAKKHFWAMSISTKPHNGPMTAHKVVKRVLVEDKK